MYKLYLVGYVLFHPLHSLAAKALNLMLLIHSDQEKWKIHIFNSKPCIWPIGSIAVMVESEF
jgi:hypothetical protein